MTESKTTPTSKLRKIAHKVCRYLSQCCYQDEKNPTACTIKNCAAMKAVSSAYNLGKRHD